MIYYPVKYIYNYKRTDQDFCTTSITQQFKLYKQTLFQIVQTKVQADFEDSIQDDFTDMRQDLQNFIMEKHSVSKQEIKEEFSKLKARIDERETKMLEIIKSKDLALVRLEKEVGDIKKMLKALLDRDD